jgi:GAF domain-containing protein
MTNYTILNQTLLSLIDGVPHKTANLASAAALLYNTFENINWAGFYLIEDKNLILGPFQGKPACIEIPIGKGVCGSSVAEARTLVVPDVHEFPGHIACDGASNSEIVIPLKNSLGKIIGVLDIDSPIFNRFSDDDRAGLEQFARILTASIA